MGISLDKHLGFHEKALSLRIERSKVLASNLANAETPGFKARDIDFRAVLQRELGNKDGVEIARTAEGHMELSTEAAKGALLYRNPLQPSIDGNTVDPQMEIVEFSKNTLEFQASFLFLNNRLKGLTNALRGE